MELRPWVMNQFNQGNLKVDVLTMSAQTITSGWLSLMQILDQILQIVNEYLLYIVLILFIIIIVAAARSKRRSAGAPKSPTLKMMYKMKSTIQKGKEPAEPIVRSRQDIITEYFEEKMNSLGLEPSRESGHIPISQTPLADHLRAYGVTEDLAGAIISELPHLETKEQVEELIEAAAESAGVNLQGDAYKMAQHLAVDEWMRSREKGSQ
jgi:hypothetical protein